MCLCQKACAVCLQVKAPKDSMDEKGFFKRLEAAADDAATDDDGRRRLLQKTEPKEPKEVR